LTAKSFAVQARSGAVVAKEHKYRRGIALGGPCAGDGWVLERRVARRGGPTWGRNPREMTVLAGSTFKV
jgi:hypothetical protein